MIHALIYIIENELLQWRWKGNKNPNANRLRQWYGNDKYDENND